MLREVQMSGTGVFDPAEYQRSALILDDNDGNRMLLKFVIQMGKIEYAEAATAYHAFKLWMPGKFSFAFLDIELPDVSGLDVARQMREQDNGIAIIMCTTNDDPKTITTAIEAGCDIFLTKPFQLDTLMTMIKVLDRAQLRASSHVLVIDNTDRSRLEPRPGFLTVRSTGTMDAVGLLNKVDPRPLS